MTNNALVLSINAGSSSLKAALLQGETHVHVASFLGERLGTDKAVVHKSYNNQKEDEEIPYCSHDMALERILDFLKKNNLLDDLVGTGHRVVHGGANFRDATLITKEVLEQIGAVSHLAPLHNPHNVKGIRSVKKVLPRLPAVAVFDTAFHSTLPPKASQYAIPQNYRDIGIRKYGFHGTSVRYVSQKAKRILSQLQPSRSNSNMVVCHLGNGASITAVNGHGESIETSMGFSPLAGLMMGTRSGSIDPAVIPFAMKNFDLSAEEVLNDLNKNSGLKAMTSDHDFDMRSLLKRAQEGHDDDAILAVDMFVYRVVQFIAISLVALPGPVDAIAFTAGIGEHSSEIRKRCILQLQQTILPQLALDEARNNNDGSETNGVLTKEGSWPVCLDIATDEEAMICEDTLRVVNQTSD